MAGSEEELSGVTVRAAALAELHDPDIVDLDGVPARVAKRAEQGAALGIKGVDASPVFFPYIELGNLL